MAIPDPKQQATALITDLMCVLYEYGIREVNLGALMRLIGVDNETASEQDNDYVSLDDEFLAHVSGLQELDNMDTKNQIIH